MKENMKNDNSGVSKLLGHLAAEKKKTGIALFLIVVMAVMWGKVLIKKGPQIAQATPAIQETALERQLDEAMQITYLDLPQISGRHDVISRDFFASVGWQDFKSEEQEAGTGDFEKEDGIAPIDEIKEVGVIVAERLRLQAIVIGQNPQAFINDKLMSAGHKLIVTDGSEMYECEVVEIRENSVLIRCREAEIVLKLTETVEGDG